MGIRVVIAGGGISGLSLAYALMQNPSLDVAVFEAETRPGGKIWSDSDKGYLCESGVNGFLDNKPATLKLSQELGLSPLPSSDNARRRFVCSDGRLERLPESPPAFLKSRLISWPGKMRLFMEPFISKTTKADETLADFGRRRLGREAFEKLIDPMASGIYAGDPERLSLPSCFPRIHEIEQKYGSLIKGMLRIMAERRKSVGAGPGGKLTSYRGGMQSLIDALRDSVGERLRLKSPVDAIEKTSSGYVLHLKDATRTEADAVVLAVPAHQSTRILAGLAGEASRRLSEVHYPSLSVVCTGFRRESLKPSVDVDCFGFLVPFREGRRILGTLVDSSVFENRAPGGKVLMRTMVGGARGERYADLHDEALVKTVLEELRQIAKVDADPEFVKIYRHKQAIPQYNIGHGDIVRAAEAVPDIHRGLYVTGNALRGVSVNDCIANSTALAGRIVAEMA